MYYVYVLKSEKDKSLYIGYTTDLKDRVKRHNAGSVTSTKSKIPWKMLFYEGFSDLIDAKNREIFLKSGWGRRSLARILKKALS